MFKGTLENPPIWYYSFENKECENVNFTLKGCSVWSNGATNAPLNGLIPF